MGEILDTVEQCVEQTIARVGKQLVIGAPLGLGKPVQLLNAFYRRAEADPTISLHFYTALCLERPQSGSHIEASLAGPIMERLFGARAILPFRVAWVLAIPVGTVVELNLIWLIADTLNAFMAVPNLIALILLGPLVFRLTREYWANPLIGH